MTLAADGWTLAPGQVLPLLVLPGAYALRMRALARRGRPVSGARQASFYAGAALVLLALVSPIDTLGETRAFWIHMVQHLLIGDLGALAIVAGLDGRILRPVLAFAPVRSLRALAHPLVALPLWAASLIAWHLPGPYQAALAHPALHALEHGSFLFAGALMWAAVLEPLPGPPWFGDGWKALYVLVVRVIGMALANVFIWSGHVFYGAYRAREARFGIAPLTDQRIAGLVMFTEGGIVTLVAFAVMFLRWQRAAELRQSLLDRGADPRTAERAARYRRRSVAAPPR